MRRDKKTKRLARYVLTFETLELRCLLAFNGPGLALVQANETQTPASQIKTPPDPCDGADAKYCELLRFRFGFDAQKWSQPNTSSTRRVTGFGMSKDFDGAAGQIAGGVYLNDTPLAGDWSGSGYTNIGTARWQKVSERSVARTWVFLLSTDRDPHFDQVYNFPVQLPQVASEALLPIPLAGNLDGKNGADLAVVDVDESSTKVKQLRWRMAMEEDKPANTISYPSSPKDLQEVIFGSADAKPAVGYFREVNGAPQFGIAAASISGLNVSWSILYADTDGKYFTGNESEPIPQELNAEVKGQWEPIAGDFDGDGKADLGIIEHKGSELLLHVRGLRDPVPLTNKSRASDRVIVGKWAQTQWSSDQVSNKAPQEYDWDLEKNWQGSEEHPVDLSESPLPTSNVFIEDRGNGTLVENSIVFKGVDRQAITDIKARGVLRDAPNPPAKVINTFAAATNFSSLRIEGGENIFSGTTHIQTADLVDGIRAPNDAPAPYNLLNPGYSIYVSGGSTEFTGNTIVDAPVVVSGGVLEFASNNIQIGTLAISGTGKVILSGTGIAIQRIEIRGDGKLELRAALTGSVNLSLDGGEIVIAYNARKEPLGPNAIVNVTSNGSILSAPTPITATPESEPKYTIAHAINLQGNLTVGNVAQDPADATLSERASYLELSGNITGTGTLVKKGKGTVFLTGDSGYTGQTTVEEGELIAGSANALGATTGSTRITGGWLGILQNDKQPFTFNEPITVEALGSMNLRQSASLTGLVTLNNSVLQVEPGSTVSSTITVTGAATIEVIKPLPPNDNPPVETVVTLTAPIIGTADLNWLIPIGYTATVSSPSSRRGATRVRSGGTLQLSTPDAIPADQALEFSQQSTLDLNGNSLTVSSLTGDGKINLGTDAAPGSLVVNNSQGLSYSGTIVGAGSFTKRGSALLTLSGANSFAGDLIVESGGLNLAEANAQYTDVEVRRGNLLSVSGSNTRITTLTVDLGGTANISSASATIDSLIANGRVEIVNNGNVVRQLNIGAGGVVLMGGSLASSQNLAIAIDGGKIEFETFEPFANASITVASLGATFLAKFAKGGSSFNNPITLQNNAFATFDWDGIASPSVGFAYTGVITGTGGLRKRGSGFLNLTQKSDYSGQTQVEAGELLIGVTNALPLTTSLTVEANAIVNMENRSLEVAQIAGLGTIQGKVGAVLSVGGTNVDSTFAGRLVSSTGTANDTGSLTLTKVGTGKLTLTGTNAYTGATNVENGTLIVQGGNAMSDNSLITVSGGTLDFNNTNETIAGLSNSGKVVLGSGTITVLRNFSSNATLEARTGTLRFAASDIEAQSLAVTNGQLNNVTHNGAAELQISSGLRITGVLKNETGTIDIQGAAVATNTFTSTGGFIVDTTGGGSLASSTLLDLQSGTILVKLTGAGSLTKSLDSTVTLSAANDYTGATSINGGKLILVGGKALPDTSLITVSGGTLDFNNTSETINSLDNRATVLLGNGTTSVLGNFTSNATLQAGSGTLEFSSNGSTPQVIAVTNGLLNNLTHSGSATLNVGSQLLIEGLLSNTGGTIDIRGASVAARNFSLVSGLARDTVGNGSLSTANQFDLQNGTLSVRLSGTGSLTKTTEGTVTLSGSNDYTGVTSIVGGKLILVGGNALADASMITVSSGTLDFNNTSETIAGLNNLATVLLGNGITRVLGNFTSNATLQAGTGTLDFASNGSAQQTVAITNGRLNNLSHSGSATLSVESALLIDGSVINQAGTIDLNGATVSSDRFTLQGGSISDRIGSGSLTSTTEFDLRSGTVAAKLNGSGGLLKSTSGVVLITSKNSLSGIATIDAGTLRLGSGANLDGLSNLIVSRPGTLDLNDQPLSVSGLAGTGTIVLGAGLLTASMAVDGAFGGTISGTGGLIKQGSGLLDLSGANEYLGDTHIAGGTLVLSSKNAVSQSARMLIDTSGTLEIRASEQSIRGLQGSGKLRLSDGTLFVDQAEQPQLFDGSIDGDGLIQKNGTASLILSGHGDYQGRLVVQSGSLQVNGTLASADALVRDGSSLQGRGTLGDVTIAEGGSLRPGNSPGRMTVNNLVLNPGSSLVFEIAGTSVGTQYDQVVVKSLADLGGRIEVVLIDGYVPKSGDVFDLVLFANRSGLPSIELPGSNGLVVWRNAFMTSTLRVIVDAISPEPGDGFIPVETGPGDGNLNSTPAPIPKLSLAREDSVRDPMLLVSLAAATNPRRNFDATDWFEQAPDYVPIDPAVHNEATAIEVVVDEILSADSFADLSSFTSDVQPYAAVSLAPPIEYFDDPPPPPLPPKNLEVPYTYIAAGTTFLLGGLAMLAMTFSKSRRRGHAGVVTAMEEFVVRLDEVESIDPLRESGVDSESVTSKGHIHG